MSLAGNRRIELALSGGGIHAMVFHLGVLKLAERDLLEEIHGVWRKLAHRALAERKRDAMAILRRFLILGVSGIEREVVQAKPTVGPQDTYLIL